MTAVPLLRAHNSRRASSLSPRYATSRLYGFAGWASATASRIRALRRSSLASDSMQGTNSASTTSIAAAIRMEVVDSDTVVLQIEGLGSTGKVQDPAGLAAQDSIGSPCTAWLRGMVRAAA